MVLKRSLLFENMNSLTSAISPNANVLISGIVLNIYLLEGCMLINIMITDLITSKEYLLGLAETLRTAISVIKGELLPFIGLCLKTAMGLH